jgi:hypothetical protein
MYNYVPKHLWLSFPCHMSGLRVSSTHLTLPGGLYEARTNCCDTWWRLALSFFCVAYCLFWVGPHVISASDQSYANRSFRPLAPRRGPLCNASPECCDTSLPESFHLHGRFIIDSMLRGAVLTEVFGIV